MNVFIARAENICPLKYETRKRDRQKIIQISCATHTGPGLSLNSKPRHWTHSLFTFRFVHTIFFPYTKLKQRRTPIFFLLSLNFTRGFLEFDRGALSWVQISYCTLFAGNENAPNQMVRCVNFLWARPKENDKKKRKTKTRQSHWATTDNDEGYDFVHEKPRKQKKTI